MGRGIRVSIDKEPVPNFSWRERERGDRVFCKCSPPQLATS